MSHDENWRKTRHGIHSWEDSHNLLWRCSQVQVHARASDDPSSCVSCRLRKFVREQTYICTSRAVLKANFGVCQGIWHAISVQDAFKCSQGAFKCIVALDFRTSRWKQVICPRCNTESGFALMEKLGFVKLSLNFNLMKKFPFGQLLSSNSFWPNSFKIAYCNCLEGCQLAVEELSMFFWT